MLRHGSNNRTKFGGTTHLSDLWFQAQMQQLRKCRKKVVPFGQEGVEALTAILDKARVNAGPEFRS